MRAVSAVDCEGWGIERLRGAGGVGREKAMIYILVAISYDLPDLALSSSRIIVEQELRRPSGKRTALGLTWVPVPSLGSSLGYMCSSSWCWRSVAMATHRFFESKSPTTKQVTVVSPETTSRPEWPGGRGRVSLGRAQWEGHTHWEAL